MESLKSMVDDCNGRHFVCEDCSLYLCELLEQMGVSYEVKIGGR